MGNISLYFEQVAGFSREYRCTSMCFPGYGDSGEANDRGVLGKYGEGAQRGRSGAGARTPAYLWKGALKGAGMERKTSRVVSAAVVIALLGLVVFLGAANSPAAGSNPHVIDNVAIDHNVMVTSYPLPPDIQSVAPQEGKPGTKVTISGNGFGDSRGSSTVTVGGALAEVVSWSDTKIVIIVPGGAASGAIVVSTPGGANARVFTVCYPTWYLAEGSTAWGFTTNINMENPNPNEVTARITYFDSQFPLGMGAVKTRDVKLPAMSQTVLSANSDLGYEVDFSTRVDCLKGQTIAVDRTMLWLSGMGEARGTNNSIGVTLPATTWYLPEGSSNYGFETWTLVENPGAKDAEVTLTYMVEGVGPRPVTHAVSAYSRATFKMSEDIGLADASIKVTSDVPVIPERSMYRYWISPQTGENTRREGHESIGATTPSTDYYLAEGTTAWGFTTYVLVQNPNKTQATVTITYNTGAGAIPTDPFTMPGESRKTVRVNDAVPNRDLSTHVHADVPIIAERSMYWRSNGSVVDAMHDSIGTPGAHLVWYLPDGYSPMFDNRSETETYTLVQNPGDVDVEIEVSYLVHGGSNGSSVVFTDTVKANSRKTYSLNQWSGRGASVMVRCLPPDPTMAASGMSPGVIVERSMYYGGRWSGANTVGAFDDIFQPI